MTVALHCYCKHVGPAGCRILSHGLPAATFACSILVEVNTKGFLYVFC